MVLPPPALPALQPKQAVGVFRSAEAEALSRSAAEAEALRAHLKAGEVWVPVQERFARLRWAAAALSRLEQAEAAALPILRHLNL